MNLGILKNWTNPILKMDLVELKMLQNEQLVGDWTGNMLMKNEKDEKGAIYFFFARPKMNFSDLDKKYGEPSAKQNINDWIIWTYSRFRFIGKPNENIAVIAWSALEIDHK